MIIAVPARTDGNLTPKGVRPNTFMKGVVNSIDRGAIKWVSIKPKLWEKSEKVSFIFESLRTCDASPIFNSFCNNTGGICERLARRNHNEERRTKRSITTRIVVKSIL